MNNPSLREEEKEVVPSDNGAGSSRPSSEKPKALPPPSPNSEGEGAIEVEKKKHEGPSTEEASMAGTVFSIHLHQTPSNLRHKMSVPELCRNFSAVAWCGKLNVIACASETCARIPSSNVKPPFWIPIHIVNPERPTEHAVFDVPADSPRDSVQFLEWSPISCPRALLVANFQGRITIWTQPSQGAVNLVRAVNCWHCEHEWRQDLAVVTKWLSGMSLYRWPPSNSSNSSSKMTFEERFLSYQQQASARWPNFLCVCSVFSSGSVQLHWSQCPPLQVDTSPKWFSTSKAVLGAGPSGIMAADAIITEAGTMHVAGVPIVNPSTVVVWEVTPGPGNSLQATTKANSGNGIPPFVNPPSWTGFAPLAAYLFSWQEYLVAEGKQSQKQTDQDMNQTVSLHCSPVSNFSAYVSPEAASQATTTWGSGVTAVAFDPARGGSVIAVVIIEGQYMSPYDPDEGPSITGWRVQIWESSLQPVVLHPLFENSASNFGGQPPMQTVWQTKVNKSIPPRSDIKGPQTPPMTGNLPDERNSTETGALKANILSFDPYDLPSDVRILAQIVFSGHGGEVAVAFLLGEVRLFSGANFSPVDYYNVNVGSTIAAPAFSSSSCCLASVWHDTSRDCTVLKIIRVLPPAVLSIQAKANSATWERAIADRLWWSLMAGVDWWDAVGCTQSAAEDGIVYLNSVIAVLDSDFHSLPSIQHRQQYGTGLDRIKCRLLEGTVAQDVRALVLDMQARLLLDMLGKGIESSLINPSALLSEPWLASGETLSGLGADAMAVEPQLVPCIQGYVDAVLDLASHFLTRLRRYASFCRTLASHANAGSARSMVASPSHSSAQTTSQGSQSGSSNTTGSTQMQAWVQGAIAKISNTSDGSSSLTPNPMGGHTPFMPISINTGTFPGTPAVRLIGDCHFLHKLCQLLLFCLFFRRRQWPRATGPTLRNPETNPLKPQTVAAGGGKGLEETNNVGARPSAPVSLKPEEGQASRVGQLIPGAKGLEEVSGGRPLRLGSGNAGQGYTSEEVKVLFLVLADLCKRTASLPHPLPQSQVGGASNIIIRLHYIDGNYTVLPEVVEASLGPHMQNLPRPRGADAAGLLLRELELHPPAEEWHKRNMFGGPWSELEEDQTPSLRSTSSVAEPWEFDSSQDYDSYNGVQGLWPRKRRLSERDAAFGLKTSVGLGGYLGLMGSRRDVIMAVWKTGLEGVWHKCIRCLRQTSALALPGPTNPQSDREAWWISRWAYGCPMCGGPWVRVV
ncbi:mediator of RNA polymerase II transcription subunit 16 isoform X1 [Amborella trichopoda]|uniref:Mediator of RNA polymerase II transcription subunit 16 n=1 Tax=Amborella trichopoda TaxID=13333 RepID=W1NIA8_AMBTC|nr:mediator of RNA polymerase II transcription subunit 16 isoform X1 [Amborella trichopoda]ERM95218.1 hypothetical protein AMTR_s00009p00267330 [Amborella trichopoda]|eukprot:XP_006827802.1 mediator of RNA polymerase II transcription subunit 16 isoform X1 [Amborella trichopoda]